MKPLALATAILLVSAASAQQAPTIDLAVIRDQAPGPKVQASLTTRNVRTAAVGIIRVPNAALWNPRLRSGRLVRTITVEVAAKTPPPRKGEDAYYQRVFSLPALPSGVYMLTAGKDRELVNITQLAVLAKYDSSRALAWVSNALTGRPVFGAKARFLTRDGGEIAAAVSDEKGVAALKLPKDAKPSWVVVERGGDAAAMPAEESGTLERRALFQLDRSLYRPGDTVQGKLTLRMPTSGADFQIPAPTALAFEVRNPLGLLLHRSSAKTTAWGTAPFTFTIPGEGALGRYELRVLAGKEVLAMSAVEVQEYRKPEFKVSFEHDRKRLLAGDKLKTTVAVETYFGARVPGAAVEWSITQNAPFQPVRFDANLDGRSIWTEPRLLAQGVSKTNANGVVELMASIPKEVEAGTASILVTATDNANREITASTSLPVFPGEVIVAVRPQVGYVPLGKLFPVEVSLRNPEGKPVSGSVRLTTERRELREKTKDWIWKVYSDQVVKVPASGAATVEVPAKVEGISIMAQAQDASGRVSRDSASIYVASPFERSQETRRQPMLEIKVKKDSIAPGEDIEAYVQTNTKSPVLVVLEGAGLWEHKVVQGSGPVVFRARKDMHPVVTVSAAQWSSTNSLGSSALVRVTDPAKKLVVKISPSTPEAEPGSLTKWTIKTTLGSGRPAAADLALAVVDQSLLDISSDAAADPYAAFYGYWPSRVQTVGTRPAVFEGGAYQRRPTAAKAADSSGGVAMSGHPGAAPIRQNFADVAHWRWDLATDDQGLAEVSFNLPDNLTTWRATAGGTTLDTAAGEGAAALKATRPFTLRLAVPRQMAKDDMLLARATINNRTAQERSLSVRVSRGGQSHTLNAKVAARGQASVDFPLLGAENGPSEVMGELLDEQGVRLDAVVNRFPVRSGGIAQRLAASGVAGKAPVKIDLPAQRVQGEGRVLVTLFAGYQGLVRKLRKDVIDEFRWSPLVAAAQLALLADNPNQWQNPDLQAVYGVLARTDSGGWGVFERADVDPIVTARVAIAAYEARVIRETGEAFSQRAKERLAQIEDPGRPDDLAFVFLAWSLHGGDQARQWKNRAWEAREIASPTGRLALAEGLLRLKDQAAAAEVVAPLLAAVSRGPSGAWLPTGEGMGWTGSPLEATLRLLRVLGMMDRDRELQAELAAWISTEGLEWAPITERSLAVQVLREHGARNPSPERLGPAQVTINGLTTKLEPSPDGDWAEAMAPLGAEDRLEVSVAGADGTRCIVEANPSVQVEAEGGQGVRTFFRWEVQTGSGSWEELNRPIKAGEPVRCTAVVWGDAIADVVKVTLPVPAGFEVMDTESDGRVEVRDGAVIAYDLVADGRPSSFRVFLRSEIPGTVKVPAATAEVVRRPQRRGWSSQAKVVVKP